MTDPQPNPGSSRQTTINKHAALLALARKRQANPWEGYKAIGGYHGGAYECDFVSPYTKTAGNVDSEIFVMLQDWCSDSLLSKPLDPKIADLGHLPRLPTNRNLAKMLQACFGKTLADVYGTNLFPFIKPGNMSAPIPMEHMVQAAREFGLPQIRIVRPRMVICLGLATFTALQQACGINTSGDFPAAIASPFDFEGARIWCQAHTGARGQNNRNKDGVDRVSQDWQRMKLDVFGAA